MYKYLIIIILFLPDIASSQNNITSTTILNEYSKKANHLSETGKIDSSLYYFKLAIHIAKTIPDSISLTRLLREQAKTFELKGNYSAALTSYLTAIKFAKKTNQNTESGLCYIGLSNINYRTANTELALSNSIEAATIFKSLNDTANYIMASGLMGQVYIFLKKYDDAFSIFNEMMELSKTSNDTSKWALTCNYLGAAYMFQENYEKALEYYLKALDLNKQISDYIYMGISLGNIGEVYMKKGQYQIALKTLYQALEIEQKQEFSSGIIFLYYTLGETYSFLENQILAMDFFNKSLELINKLGEIRETPVVYQLIAEHYARNGDFKNSYHFYKQFDTSKDSLTKVMTIYNIDELKTKYELEKKEHDIKSLTLEKRVQEQELRSSKEQIRLQLIIIILVVLGLISSFIFTFSFLRSRKQLKTTNKTKDILFSIIGHDLRGPMGNIKQIVNSIQSPNFPDREKYIQLLQQPAEASYILLEDLLAWSRSISNKMIYNPKLIPVEETIGKTFDLLRSLADKKNILLKSEVPEYVVVFAEYNHFSAILRNFVSNAIKFTPIGGSITISHKYEGNMIKIMVTDTGIGIEPQSIKKILDTNSFYSTFGTNNEKGSGLGLVLCQKFIKKNGGIFGIDSTPKKGSTFHFTLPFEIS